ncbi:MAG TPA: LOG family protein, partial [Candidatus Angelobacter sp.]|nr:LOG family protein [Candidatus Angelobacter sp.]
MKRICVFCGSSLGARPAYKHAAQRLGELLAERGIGLVFGGGCVGLMGAVADAALAKGGEVIGVIPESLVRREIGHRGVTRLHVVETMHQR